MYSIRTIEPHDNAQVEAVIRSCLIEYGANHEGTAWSDPYLGRFSEVYEPVDSEYWVAVDESGRVVGGVGIGALPGVEGVCELQKMYCLPEARGTGVAHRLMDEALAFAAAHYRTVYLETLPNMLAAQRFYEKRGFTRCEPMGATGHVACDVCYSREV